MIHDTAIEIDLPMSAAELAGAGEITRSAEEVSLNVQGDVTRLTVLEDGRQRSFVFAS